MKLPVAVASATGLWWRRSVPPNALFFSVLCCFPAFLFQRNILILAIEAAVFFLLALTRRGHIRLLPSVMMVVFVTLFSLLSPYGRVLFRVGGAGGFAITLGALEGGLRRGVLLVGMVFLSQLAVSRQVSLPGRMGMFVAQVFMYLDELGRERLQLRPGHIIDAIDEKLCQVYSCGGYIPYENERYPERSASGFVHWAEKERADSLDESTTAGTSGSVSHDSTQSSGPAGYAFLVLLPAVLYILLFCA